MKILLVTANFATADVNPWLLDDLANELALQGHDVDVIVHSPTAPRARGASGSPRHNRVSTFSVGCTVAPTGGVRKLGAYLNALIRLHTTGWRHARQNKYDLCIYTSIGAFSGGFPRRVRKRGIASHLLFVMWDFFPIHQVEIGRMRPGPHIALVKSLERLSISIADTIAVMTPANEAFLARYHPGLTASIVHIPPWAAPDPGGADPAKRPNFTVVFGGQLVKGRGMDTLLAAAAQVQESQPDIRFIVAGDGTEMANLKELSLALRLTNVTFTGALARDQYRQLLRSSHVGIAITVPGVTPPSFPSKIIEYCANGIPVIVAVESSSDAGSFVEQHDAGYAVSAGKPELLTQTIVRAYSDHRAGNLTLKATNARDLFETEFSVTLAARRIVEATRDSSPMGSRNG